MYNQESNYRYRLETYNPDVRKHICPGCGKKTFVRYIDSATGEYVSTDVGKCDRIEKCGYHKRPRDFFEENGTTNTKSYFFPKKEESRDNAPDHYSTVAMSLVADTKREYEHNNLILYLYALFGKAAVRQILSSYHIGTTRYWPGATVFWQVDKDGRCRTGKIMLYDRETGHRIKNPTSRIMWVHKLPLFRDFTLQQCLFGEHLLKNSAAPVALVESEKTAVIASLFFRDVIWLATGGLENLREASTQCLVGHRVYLFPDLGAEEKWAAKAGTIPALRDAMVSTWLQRNSTDEQKAQGLDIGDWLVTRPIGRNMRVEDYL